MKKDLIIITGPTGVGKTELSEQLCKKINGEIINIDLGQFYTQLNIGTAKPNLDIAEVKHHLFNIVDEPINFTVAEYRKIVLDKINEIWQRSKRAVLVGGSGFYITSLLFPPQANTNISTDLPQENLWETLNSLDPERAAKLHPNDTYRIKRALSILYTTKKRASSFAPQAEIFYDRLFLVVLERDRDNLYKRINIRTEEMFRMGWVREVKNLTEVWKNFLKQKKIIGYDDIIRFIESKQIEIDNLIPIIQQKTRNYAKRQISYFKMLQRLIKENLINKNIDAYIYSINLDDKNLDLCTTQLLDKIIEV